jgi:hypothetical protein
MHEVAAPNALAWGGGGVYEPSDKGCAESAASPLGWVAGAALRLGGTGRVLLALVVTLAFASSARAAASVPLGTADNFAVLAGSAVTNTGPTVVTGDLGLSPGTSVTGFPPGTVNGSNT